MTGREFLGVTVFKYIPNFYIKTHLESGQNVLLYILKLAAFVNYQTAAGLGVWLRFPISLLYLSLLSAKYRRSLRVVLFILFKIEKSYRSNLMLKYQLSVSLELNDINFNGIVITKDNKSCRDNNKTSWRLI